jgi:hypothetical protein
MQLSQIFKLKMTFCCKKSRNEFFMHYYIIYYQYINYFLASHFLSCPVPKFFYPALH